MDVIKNRKDIEGNCHLLTNTITTNHILQQALQFTDINANLERCELFKEI